MKKSAVLSLMAFYVGTPGMAKAENTLGSQNKAEVSSTSISYYGSLQLRQYEVQYFSDKKRTKTYSLLSVAPGIGAKLMDEKVDTFFRLRYGKANDSEAVQSLEAFNETFLYLYKNDYLTTGPYAYSSFDPSSGQYQGTNLGLDLSGNFSHDASFGGLKMGAFLRPQVVLMSKGELGKNKITPKTKDSFPLTQPAPAPVERQDMAYLNEMELSLGYTPTFVSDTTLKMVVDFSQEWNPTYVVKTPEAAASGDADFDAYKRKELTITRGVLSYKLSKETQLDGEIRQYTGGFFGYEIDSDKASEAGEITSKRTESRVSVTTSFE